MRHKLAAISNYYIITLLIVCPPVGYYFAVKYHRNWVKRHIWFTVCIACYFVILIAGLVLTNLGA